MAIYKLNEIGTFKGGLSKLNKNNYDSGINFINYMDIYRNFWIDNSICLRKYNATNKEKERYKVEYGDLLFTASSETKEDIALSTVYLSNDPAIFNGFSKIFKYDQNLFLPKYAGYYFRNKYFRNQVIKLASGYTRINISQKDLNSITINIPSLEIQKQVIDIIKPLEQQMTLLEKSINLYKKYSNHITQNLVNIDNINFSDKNIYKLGEICKIKAGIAKYTPDYIEQNKGEYPVFSSKTVDNGLIGKMSTYDYDGEYITITTRGKFAGTVFYRNEKFSITHISWIIENLKKLILTKYLYYYLKIDLEKKRTLYLSGSAVPALYVNILINFKLSIPSLEIQKQVISIIEPLEEKIKLLERKKELLDSKFKYYQNLLIIGHVNE